LAPLGSSSGVKQIGCSEESSDPLAVDTWFCCLATTIGYGGRFAIAADFF